MQRLTLINACLQEIWRPHLGDPSLGGIGLTLLYIVASLLFLRAILAQDGWQPRERLLWVACTVILVLLTLNKQLDLQQTIIWVGRCVAKHEGWFDQRLTFQREFGMVILAAVVLAILAFGWICRSVLSANWPLLLGMAMLTLFIVLQITRFEQLAGGMAQTIVALHLHRILEGAALCVLIWSAWRGRLTRR